MVWIFLYQYGKRVKQVNTAEHLQRSKAKGSNGKVMRMDTLLNCLVPPNQSEIIKTTVAYNKNPTKTPTPSCLKISCGFRPLVLWKHGDTSWLISELWKWITMSPPKSGSKWHHHYGTVGLVYQLLLSSHFYNGCTSSSSCLCQQTGNSENSLRNEAGFDFAILDCAWYFTHIGPNAKFEKYNLRLQKKTVSWCGCWFWVPHKRQKGSQEQI